MIVEICDELDVELSPADIIPANFNSVKAMYAKIEKLKK